MANARNASFFSKGDKVTWTSPNGETRKGEVVEILVKEDKVRVDGDNDKTYAVKAANLQKQRGRKMGSTVAAKEVPAPKKTQTSAKALASKDSDTAELLGADELEAMITACRDMAEAAADMAERLEDHLAALQNEPEEQAEEVEAPKRNRFSVAKASAKPVKKGARKPAMEDAVEEEV